MLILYLITVCNCALSQEGKLKDLKMSKIILLAREYLTSFRTAF